MPLPSVRMIRKHCPMLGHHDLEMADATAHLGDIFSVALEKGRNVEAILVTLDRLPSKLGVYTQCRPVLRGSFHLRAQRSNAVNWPVAT